MSAMGKFGVARSEENTRRYIAEMLDQMAEIAEGLSGHDMGNLAFQLRILAHKAVHPSLNS